ncbi:5-demethoxyubiquinol-8 5-hydroxylase UbiM [Zhengella sp. ZM62]|uniref:5-demethoxyubiquinol-8 5-hydroxylase UbiM n=1 Tax=Zhengella sedimenti TaxID=3390035 RepID=UPI003976F35D
MTMSCDVMIVGAGPVGLAFARSLAESGLEILIVEQAELATLKAPPPDGRAIALNHRSMGILERLDVAGRFAPEHRSYLRRAEVLDGASPFALVFDAAARNAATLGWLVPNHAIRKAVFESFSHHGGARLMAGVKAGAVRRVEDGVAVSLSDGTVVETRLLVAADTRFSALRRQMGISAFMHDFGRSMIVCDMAHEAEHGDTALEGFFHGVTIATLPLTGRRSSIVVTLPSHEAEPLMADGTDAIAAMAEREMKGRLGRLTPLADAHLYPLVAVYAHAFHADRFALIGDAAVGMHPVTAHGFNFGLLSQHLLASEILSALREDRDIAATEGLARYARAHRRETFPLFHATNGIASLYANETAPARLLRSAGLRLAHALPPFRDLVVARLTASM